MKKSLIIALIILVVVIVAGFLIYARFTGYAISTPTSSVYRSARYLSMDSTGTKISVYVYVNSAEPVIGVSEKIPRGFNVTSSSGYSTIKSDAIEWLFVSGGRGVVAYTLYSPNQVRQVNLTGNWYTGENEREIPATSLRR